MKRKNNTKIHKRLKRIKYRKLEKKSQYKTQNITDISKTKEREREREREKRIFDASVEIVVSRAQ